MMLLRLVIGLLLLAGVLCLAMAIATRDRRWSQRGTIVIKWTVIAGLALLAVLILERLALLL
jgi:hypothetical protein